MVKMRMPRSLCWLLSFIIVFPLNGCTIVEPVASGDGNLPSRIRAENLISEGDRVEIRTVDDREYQFEVVAVDDDIVRGKAVSVRIDDIAELSVRRFSGQRTAALVVVVIGAWLAIMEAAGNSARNQL